MTDPSIVDSGGNIIQFKDKMHRASYEQLAELISKRNGFVAQANAAHGDKESLYESVMENSEDPKIVKAREQRDEAVLLLHKLVTPEVDKFMSTSAETLTQVENDVKEIDTILKAGASYFRKLYGDDSAKQLPEQTRARSLKVGGGGSGGRRIRGFNVITQFKGKTEEHENFTNAAKTLGLETSVLQSAFFETAKVDSAKEAPNTVEYTLEVTEVDADSNETKVTASIKAYRTEVEAPAAETPAAEPVPA